MFKRCHLLSCSYSKIRSWPYTLVVSFLFYQNQNNKPLGYVKEYEYDKSNNH